MKPGENMLSAKSRTTAAAATTATTGRLVCYFRSREKASWRGRGLEGAVPGWRERVTSHVLDFSLQSGEMGVFTCQNSSNSTRLKIFLYFSYIYFVSLPMRIAFVGFCLLQFNTSFHLIKENKSYAMLILMVLLISK
jgi:hypothetical protein